MVRKYISPSCLAGLEGVGTAGGIIVGGSFTKGGVAVVGFMGVSIPGGEGVIGGGGGGGVGL